MKRNVYDKSCYAAVTGMMGRLQTVHNIPVVAGETYSIDLVGALRLSRLKRYLTLDANVHIAAYFVKHRWVYDNWDSFVKTSMADERSSPTTLSTTSETQQYAKLDMLGQMPVGTGGSNSITVPDHYIQGYNKIFNFYYRIPNVTAELDETSIPTEVGAITDNLRVRRYGRQIARLPSFWNSGADDTIVNNAAYADVSGDIETGHDFSLLDIANVQAEYRDQVDLDWFAHRYRDIMESRWGSNGINVDVDERPELLIDQTTWLSGIDINATAENIGDYKGKSQGIINFRMPPKYFNEHGMIWIVMALRYPPIMMQECHWDTCHALTADNFLGYPEAIKRKPPESLDEGDFTGNGSVVSWGTHPYGQKWRTLNNRICNDFHDKEGYPFVDADDITTHADAAYDDGGHQLAESPTRAFFTDAELGHWNLVSKLEIECRSPIPTARESLYAGASL